MPASTVEGYEAQSGALRSINEALSSQIKLLEERIKLDKEAKRSTYGMSRSLDTVSKTQESFNMLLGKGRDFMNKYSAAAITTAAALRYYSIATESAAKSTARFLETGQRLDRVSLSYSAIAKRAKNYQKVTMKNARIAGVFGMELERVNAVSDQWLKVQRNISLGSKSTRDNIADLTKQTIAFSKFVGIDGAELVKKAEHRMWQYGESGEEALGRIMHLTNVTVAFNEDMERFSGKKGAYLWPDDFARVVNAAADRTDGFVENVESLSAAMAASAKWAQKAGLSYNESLVAAEAMGKLLTGATGGARLSIGLKMVEDIDKAIDAQGKLKDNYIQGLTETEKAEIERIAALKASDRERAELLYDALKGSEVSVKATLDSITEWGIKGESTIPFLERQLGMTKHEASLIQSMLESGKSRAEIEAEILSINKRSRAMTLGHILDTNSLTKAVRALAGAASGNVIMSKIMEGVDYIKGLFVAATENADLMFAVMVGGAAVVGSQVVRHIGTLVAGLRQAGLTMKAVATLTTHAANEAQRYAAALRSGTP